MIGKLQYDTTLPLQEKEVVLTFDDGPLSPLTTQALDVLAAHRLKATFFLIGKMAAQFPTLVRRMYQEGHCIGTHSQSHPVPFGSLSEASAKVEIEDGIASVGKAVRNSGCISPFFRFPGLGRSSRLEGYLNSRSLSIWSADVVADDWMDIAPQEVVKRALSRLHNRRGGILLLHDIHRRTTIALPWLLRELNQRGYRFVHILSASAS